MTKEYQNYLAHHGIKGQKWGVRRFQNEDGTLKNPKSRRKTGSAAWNGKDARTLSDEELNRRTNRLQKEQQYRQLTETKWDKARKWIANTASTVIVVSAIGAAKGHMAGRWKAGITKYAPKAAQLFKNLGATALSVIKRAGPRASSSKWLL